MKFKEAVILGCYEYWHPLGSTTYINQLRLFLQDAGYKVLLVQLSQETMGIPRTCRHLDGTYVRMSLRYLEEHYCTRNIPIFVLGVNRSKQVHAKGIRHTMWRVYDRLLRVYPNSHMVLQNIDDAEYMCCGAMTMELCATPPIVCSQTMADTLHFKSEYIPQPYTPVQLLPQRKTVIGINACRLDVGRMAREILTANELLTGEGTFRGYQCVGRLPHSCFADSMRKRFYRFLTDRSCRPIKEYAIRVAHPRKHHVIRPESLYGRALISTCLRRSVDGDPCGVIDYAMLESWAGGCVPIITEDHWRSCSKDMHIENATMIVPSDEGVVEGLVNTYIAAQEHMQDNNMTWWETRLEAGREILRQHSFEAIGHRFVARMEGPARGSE